MTLVGRDIHRLQQPLRAPTRLRGQRLLRQRHAAFGGFINQSTASTVTIDAASVINASAIGSGNGGRVVAWANDSLTVAGLIKALGGAQGVNGGLVETSGGAVNFAAISPAAGKTGTWLVDPTNLTVDSTRRQSRASRSIAPPASVPAQRQCTSRGSRPIAGLDAGAARHRGIEGLAAHRTTGIGWQPSVKRQKLPEATRNAQCGQAMQLLLDGVPERWRDAEVA